MEIQIETFWEAGAPKGAEILTEKNWQVHPTDATYPVPLRSICGTTVHVNKVFLLDKTDAPPGAVNPDWEELTGASYRCY
jgi:hypothetical protein